MRESIVQAIEAFAMNHKKMLPTNFVIYRDGVSDAQRAQVIQHEIP